MKCCSYDVCERNFIIHILGLFCLLKPVLAIEVHPLMARLICCVIVGDVINVLGTIFSQFFFCIFSFPSSYLSSMVHLPQGLPITPLPFLPHLFSHLHSFPSNVRKNTVKIHLKRDCWNDRYCHVCSMKHTFLLEKSILIKSVFND